MSLYFQPKSLFKLSFSITSQVHPNKSHELLPVFNHKTRMYYDDKTNLVNDWTDSSHSSGLYDSVNLSRHTIFHHESQE